MSEILENKDGEWIKARCDPDYCIYDDCMLDKIYCPENLKNYYKQEQIRRYYANKRKKAK